ncbi:MAG TPA: hypothetical protein EYN74_09295 [Nitrospirales bacterium]|nr:hypothetical protein [Nitrospirales bacterium]
MVGRLKHLAVSVMLIVPVSLALGVAVSPAAGPKYPLVTLEIPPVINDIGAPTAILSSLQETVIEEFRKKNLFAGVLPATEVLDGVLTIQGTALSWDASEAMEASGGGLLTVRLAIFQKIVPCPFNRAVIKGVVSPEMLKTGAVQPDHALVKGALAFLTSVTGDE